MEENKELEEIWKELEEEAYSITHHNYSYKQANQIIRKHFEAKQREIVELKQGVRFIFNVCDIRNPLFFHIRKKCQELLTPKNKTNGGN
jgi:hypothetical protein